jgi:hypothetical protein
MQGLPMLYKLWSTMWTISRLWARWSILNTHTLCGVLACHTTHWPHGLKHWKTWLGEGRVECCKKHGDICHKKTQGVGNV